MPSSFATAESAKNHRNGFGIVIGWATLATVFGLVGWAAIVAAAIVVDGPASMITGYASLVVAMVFASFVAVVVGLPVALFLTTLWYFVIARRFPQLDRTWAGLLFGGVILALIVSILYYGICTWAFVQDTRYSFNSIALFSAVAAGLLLPRKLFYWLRPGTFTR